jgi:hypothetical protein
MFGMLVLFLLWIARSESLSFQRMLGAITPAWVAGVAMYWVVVHAAELLHGQALWLRLGAEVATGAVIYLGLVLVMWRVRGAPAGPEREVVERLRRLLARN